METGKFTLDGDDIIVIYVGKKFYFHSNYFGLVGIATRESDISDLSDRKYAKFSLIAGPKKVYRYKYVTAIKRYINKAYKKFGVSVDYVDSGEICNHYLYIEDKEY